MFKTVNGGKLPTKGSEYSACVDLYANEDVVIGTGETKLIPLGVAIDLDSFKKNNSDLFIVQNMKLLGENKIDIIDEFSEKQFQQWLSSHYLQLMLRSSLSKELIIANGVGVVDLDYPGEIMIRVHKPLKPYVLTDLATKAKKGYIQHTDKIEIKKGDRVAQITLLEHKAYLFGIDSEDERVGGFGSTGK